MGAVRGLGQAGTGCRRKRGASAASPGEYESGFAGALARRHRSMFGLSPIGGAELAEDTALTDRRRRAMIIMIKEDVRARAGILRFYATGYWLLRPATNSGARSAIPARQGARTQPSRHAGMLLDAVATPDALCADPENLGSPPCPCSPSPRIRRKDKEPESR
jgi:hypothetical protein